jgi:hypothetical protein
MQYFITYVLGHQAISGKKADIGTIVHKTLELLASLKKTHQDTSSKAKKLLLVDDNIGKISIDKQHLFSDKIVPELLDKSFGYYSANSHHDFTKLDKEMCESLVWTTLEFNNGQFDPRNRNIVAAEPHFDIPIEEDWAKYTYTLPDGQVVNGQLAIKGTIDLVTKVDKKIIEVVDYKTGRRLDWATGAEKDYEKLCSDPQLLLYNYAISKLFPEYDQAIMSIFFIKDGGPFSMCFDKSDRSKFLDMLRVRFKDIQENNKPRPISADRSNWKCTKLCHFCKNNWKDTDESMCIYIENHIKKHGMEQTVANCTRENFNIGFYEAPG